MPVTTALSTIEDKQHVTIFVLLVKFLKLRKHIPLEQSGTNNEDSSVGVAGHNLCIGNDFDRRTVEEDIIVLRAKLIQQILQTAISKQLCRVWRNHSDRQHKEVAISTVGTHKARKLYILAHQIVRKSNLRRAHDGRRSTLTQVTVDNQHLLLLDSKRHGEVLCNERLTTVRIEGGNKNDILLSVARCDNFQLGTHHAESLIDDIMLTLLHNNICMTFFHFLPRQTELLLDSQWDLANERYCNVLQILLAAKFRVHTCSQNNDTNRNGQTKDERNHQNHVLLRRNRNH